MVILSPEGTSEEKHAGLAPRRFKTLDGVRLGLLGNTKLNADRVLEAIGDVLGERYALETVVHMTKGTFSRPAEDNVFKEMVEKCDVVVVGVGD